MKHQFGIWIFAVILAIGMGHALDVHAAQVNFNPSVTASQEYNDNIFLDPEDEESDYITSLGIGLQGEILWRTAGIQLNYDPSKFWYHDNDDQDYWRHQASGNAWYDFSRNTRIEVRNTYLRTANPSDESALIDPDAPLSGRDVDRDLNRQGLEKYYRNVTSARLSYQFGERDNLFVDYSYSVQRNINASPDNTNEEHDISGPSAGLAYWFTNQWGTELNGSYSNRNLKFDENRDVYDGTGRLLYRFTRHLDGFVGYRHTYVDYDEEEFNANYHVYQPEIGIFYQFEENSYARIGLGYYNQDKDSNDNPDVDDSDNDGFIINSEAYKAWPFRRGQISILALSGYDQDDTGSEDLGLNVFYQGRLDANYALFRRLTADAFVGFRWDDYPDEEEDRTDKTWIAGAGFEYQPFPWLTSRLEYTYRDKDSDVDSQEYTENRVFFSITIAPDQPFSILR
jgi:hypothetical protein